MDTSKEYIKMCEKAVEIRGLWEQRIGDFFFDAITGIRVQWESGDMRFASIPTSESAVWLPRQDQLQEMVWENIVENDPLRGECVKSQKPELLSNNFNKYVMKDGDRPRLESMEQLWLAFVMKELYSKTWNGKEWMKG
ncbi:MAG: hypothetical protein J7M30_02120 [Deltaproteobacteria bacterium]|nr:hypothetical protein [Deltaproteobacteria bacterium]